MAYSTVADLKLLLPEEELLQLTDDEGAGVLNEARAIEAIDQADREIDGYAGVARTVPLSPVPGLIGNLSAKMAVYHLFCRRSRVPEVWQGHYDNAVRLLTRIAEGKLTLGAAPGESAVPESARPASVTVDRIFTAEAMDGF